MECMTVLSHINNKNVYTKKKEKNITNGHGQVKLVMEMVYMKIYIKYCGVVKLVKC